MNPVQRLRGITKGQALFPLVVLFGPSYADPTGLKGVEGLSHRRPDIGALLVVEELSTELLRMALRAGVRDVIELPAESSQLLDAIERVAETIRVLPRPPEATLPAESPAELGGVITVFSPKGASAGPSSRPTSPSPLPATPRVRWCSWTPTSSSARWR